MVLAKKIDLDGRATSVPTATDTLIEPAFKRVCLHEIDQLGDFCRPYIDEKLYSEDGSCALRNTRSVILAAMLQANNSNDLDTFHRLDEVYDAVQQIIDDVEALA